MPVVAGSSLSPPGPPSQRAHDFGRRGYATVEGGTPCASSVGWERVWSWVVAGVVALLGVVLSVTVILLPLGIPLLMLARQSVRRRCGHGAPEGGPAPGGCAERSSQAEAQAEVRLQAQEQVRALRRLGHRLKLGKSQDFRRPGAPGAPDPRDHQQSGGRATKPLSSHRQRGLAAPCASTRKRRTARELARGTSSTARRQETRPGG